MKLNFQYFSMTQTGPAWEAIHAPATRRPTSPETSRSRNSS
jgi:hypothetical protein